MKRKPPEGNVRRVASIDRNFRGITTNKRGRIVQFESEQERKLILLLERDKAVADYESQPETLYFDDAFGHPKRYTPDFKVRRIDGSIELHEVSVEQRREQLNLRVREAAALRICQARGWRYVIHTDHTLPQQGEYVNLSFLSMFRATAYLAEGVEVWWRGQLSCASLHPTRVLASVATPTQGVLLNGLYHLIWHDQIGIDWRQAFIVKGEFAPTARVWCQEVGIDTQVTSTCDVSASEVVL